MNKKLLYGVGFVGSIASIIALVIAFFPDTRELEKTIDNIQIQSGQGNMQAGRDLIVNHNGESRRGEAIFLYEERIEIYWNEWWAHPLRTREDIEKLGQANVSITGEGKTVDFAGVISMNCSNGKYFWKTASNLGHTLSGDEEIDSYVPEQVSRNIYKLFCRGRY